MVRSTKWMTSMAVGLLITWQGLPAQAQQSVRHGRPTPSRTRQVEINDDSDEKVEESEEFSEDPIEAPQIDDSNGTPRAPRANRSQSRSFGPQERELIKERYPDGSVRVEREVSQDEEGNYHNHGFWKTWDNKGNLLAQGEFSSGSRTGTWVRWYRNPADVPLFGKLPFSKFNGPYISQAMFNNDQLDGFWTIYDGKKAKISQIEYKGGKRNGTTTFWHANGTKMREAQYRDGELHGQVLEWNPDGTLTVKDTYQNGHRLAPKVVAKYQDGNKKSEGMFLFAKEIEQSPDDWWNCRMQTTTKQGRDERHGPWTTWYSNGQVQLEGNFEHDLQHGQFTWWHQNGQKVLEGRFDKGKQNGIWTWWFPTGQKSIRGEYAHGNPTGRWTWWKEDGKVAQSADLSNSDNGVVIDAPSNGDLDDMPQAKKPRVRDTSR
jgi:antitoxin component YwqK of YwqJK toxin-antitoxin module